VFVLSLISFDHSRGFVWVGIFVFLVNDDNN